MIARLAHLRERFDAVLIDLDGTLLDGDGRVAPRTRAAVRALADAGLEVLLCTGRSFHGTLEYHRALGLDTAIVAYNGEWIGRPGKPPWRYAPLPDGVLDVLAGVESRALFAFRHAGPDKVSVRTAHPHHERVTVWFSGGRLVETADELPRSDVMRVSCFFDGGNGAADACRVLDDDLRSTLRIETWPIALFPEFADVDLDLCEIQVQSRGKAEAFAYLEGTRGIPPSRTIAIGDQANDLGMLEKAGLAVAMGNGSPEIRARAHLVIGDHREEGIADWVERGAPLDADAC